MTIQTNTPAQTVSIREAALILGVSRTTLYKAIKDENFPHIKVNKTIRIPKPALDRMLGAA